PSNGVLSGTGETRTYTPNADWFGADSFTYRAYDGVDYSNTATVTITVDPINDAPVITSTPVTEVNETDSYNYQVTATDADGDDLIYSLTQDYGWLSIDSNTGLITGTALSIDFDTDYNITFQVSDGTLTSTQTYTLTVKDIPVQEDTTPPTITISYPVDGATYNSPKTMMEFEITDPNLYTCWYNLGRGEGNKSMDCNRGTVNGFSSIEGINTWTIYANDTAENEASVSITFSVDTTLPIITLIGDDPQIIIIGDAYVELG
ncbi:unnamed protein product, partial [marine sediment metagenome]